MVSYCGKIGQYVRDRTTVLRPRKRRARRNGRMVDNFEHLSVLRVPTLLQALKTRPVDGFLFGFPRQNTVPEL